MVLVWFGCVGFNLVGWFSFSLVWLVGSQSFRDSFHVVFITDVLSQFLFVHEKLLLGLC
jgi:hypothetical protein